MKAISAEDKRFMRKVETRRARGLTWEEIAVDLGEPTSTVFQRFDRLQGRLLKFTMRQQAEQAAIA